MVTMRTIYFTIICKECNLIHNLIWHIKDHLANAHIKHTFSNELAVEESCAVGEPATPPTDEVVLVVVEDSTVAEETPIGAEPVTSSTEVAPEVV